MKLNKAYSCAELSTIIEAKYEKNKNNIFNTVSSLTNPEQNSLGFIFQDTVSDDLSSFTGLVVSNTFIKDVDSSVTLFRVENVKHSLSLLLNTLPNSSSYTKSEDYNNATVGKNVRIGENCIIYPGVFINHNCSIGNNVIIHPNVTIGSDGFGLYKFDGLWKKIPHVGSVVIEDDVEIGSNTTSISVYYDNAVRHTSIIPIGAASITNDIAVMLQLSLNQAELIKIKYASAVSSMSSDKLNIDISTDNKYSRSISENEISKYVEARMQEIFNLVIREISRADIKDPLTYGIVITGGGAELTNIISLAEITLGVSVRKGFPTKIEGAQDVANQPHFATVMGLLLWPLYANDHIRMRRPQNKGFKGLLNKIRHTIEEYMF